MFSVIMKQKKMMVVVVVHPVSLCYVYVCVCVCVCVCEEESGVVSEMLQASVKAGRESGRHALFLSILPPLPTHHHV
jgi:hypothetical protein